MGEQYIRVLSLTYAYQAKEILQKHGIAGRVVSAPKQSGKSGCGYALAIRFDRSRAEAILRQAGISVRDER